MGEELNSQPDVPTDKQHEVARKAAQGIQAILGSLDLDHGRPDDIMEAFDQVAILSGQAAADIYAESDPAHEE